MLLRNVEVWTCSLIIYAISCKSLKQVLGWISYKCLTIVSITGDSLAVHNGMFFSTFDSDNDGGLPYNCALAWLGGWWYNTCHDSNLNGEYGNTVGSKGINWYHWKGYYYSMKEVRMMVRKPWPWKNEKRLHLIKNSNIR